VLGSRLAYVIEKWDTQFAGRANLLGEIFNVTSGGLIYYGGVVLAVAAILGYLLWRRLPVRRYLDIITPSLMLGLAFGRAGCLLNGCCYGGPTRADFPLAMTFPYASEPLLKFGDSTNRFGAASVTPVFAAQAYLRHEDSARGRALPGWLWRGPAGEGGLKLPVELSPDQAAQAAVVRSWPVQPAQIFGIINALLICGALLWLSRLRKAEGVVFAAMLVMYAPTRFVLESIRGDNPNVQWTHNQITSVATVILGLILWAVLRRMPASAGAFARQRSAPQQAQKRKSSKKRKGKP